MTDLQLLAAIVRGDGDVSAALASADADTFCRQAAQHGVLPLVAERLVRCEHIPAGLRSRLRKRATELLALELVREAELKRVVKALDRGGVPALLLKGAHLAYSHYARPDLRPKHDTDLLVPPEARDAVCRILLGLGYERSVENSGELVAAQSMYVKRRHGRLLHIVDVHWKIANALPFAGVLTYGELAARAVAIPSLDAAARGLSGVDALVLASIHRVAHHFDSDHLIWLYDIDRIAQRFVDNEWREFVAIVRSRQVAAVCQRSLRRAVEWFGTDVPAWVWTDLASDALPAVERTARYLDRRAHLRVVLDDLRTLSTWSDRWRLVREHAFPPAAYMRGIYAPSSAAPLPLLYARRLLRGGRKWLKST